MSGQTKLNLNDIPHYLLTELNVKRAILLTSEKDEGKVFVSTTLKPEDLREIGGVEVLSDVRKDEQVYSITVVILKLDEKLIEEATSFLENRSEIISELERLLELNREVYVVYILTHHNPGQKPFGPLTVNIGGDCYRTDKAIKDFEAVLERTRTLAKAMLRKTVMIFPDIPALHGGKKGEWIILDKNGQKIHGISEEAIIALGSAIIPIGITFLNRHKEIEAREMGIFDKFPASGYVFPDSGSPDVLSGGSWRGENKDKPINLCKVWHQRGIDTRNFTCLPNNLGGTLDPSSRPTGYGVATTAVELTRRYFGNYKDKKYLIEAAGGVGRYTVEALIKKYGVEPENITIFDKAEAAHKLVAEEFPGIKTATAKAEEFYMSRLPGDGIKYDVWINNGEGDNVEPAQTEELLKAGVKIFCGGANNFLQDETQEVSLAAIFRNGGWAFPDPATSAGGWTLAVMDMVIRSKGEKANTETVRDKILNKIMFRNKELIDQVFENLEGSRDGEAIWDEVDRIIEKRVKETLESNYEPADIFAKADARKWDI
jgi:hypothetical protein